MNTKADQEVLLFGFPPSTYCRTVAIVLHEKGVPFRWIVGPTHAGWENLHPFGKVPVIKHGDIILCETLAISMYLDENFPEPPLQPGGFGRYLHMQWISYYLDYYNTALLNGSVRPRFARPTGDVDVELSLPIKAMVRCADVLSSHLSSSRYIAGDAAGLADFLYVPTILYWNLTPEGKESIASLPSLQGWLDRMARRSSVKAACFEQP